MMYTIELMLTELKWLKRLKIKDSLTRNIELIGDIQNQ